MYTRFSYLQSKHSVLVRALWVCVCLACVPITNVLAQSSNAEVKESSTGDSIFDGEPVELINEITTRIDEKKLRRETIKASAIQDNRAVTPEETAEITEISADIEQLQKSLLFSVAGESTITTLYQEPTEKTTWQEDIVDILKPLADSLKNITRRPRQIAELRAELSLLNNKEQGLKDAIAKFGVFDKKALSVSANGYINTLSLEWQDELEQLEGEQLIVSRKLQQILQNNDKPFDGAATKLRKFFLGTGLTLLLAILAAITSYFLMRAGWWFYSMKIISKDVRRKSTLHRLFSYSYHLITGIVIIISIMLVLYFREDLLLMAISFLLLAGLTFNLKQFLPRYLKEARLLLNLGSVREEERVLYNGLPWQVKSINLFSVLHNPALEGIARLPLSEMSGMVSRPVKNKLWFPTNRGDFVILPDGVLGQIKYQTPDLVELAVRGGMAQTFTTRKFYALNVTNLSREKTFGVSVTFGLDYSLQNISISDIPLVLKKAVTAKLADRGYGDDLVNLIVELSAANASSLNYIVFGTFTKNVAGDYYKLERLLLQTCVEVSNTKDWSIPSPQLTVDIQ